MFVGLYKSILANDRLVTAIIMKLFVVLCCFVLAQAQIPKPCGKFYIKILYKNHERFSFILYIESIDMVRVVFSVTLLENKMYN